MFQDLLISSCQKLPLWPQVKFFLSSSKFKSLAVLVNSQLVRFLPVGILNTIMLIFNYHISSLIISAHALISTISWISAHPLGYNIKQTLPSNKHHPPSASPPHTFLKITLRIQKEYEYLHNYYWQGLKDDEINNAYWYISVLSVQWDYGILDYDYCYNKHKTVKIWQKHCYTSLKEKLNKCPTWLRALLPKSTHPFSCHFK